MSIFALIVRKVKTALMDLLPIILVIAFFRSLSSDSRSPSWGR